MSSPITGLVWRMVGPWLSTVNLREASDTTPLPFVAVTVTICGPSSGGLKLPKSRLTVYCAPLLATREGTIWVWPTENSTLVTPDRVSVTTAVTTSEPLTKTPSAGCKNMMVGPASTRTLTEAPATTPPAVIALTWSS